jgi:hypothetical protein
MLEFLEQYKAFFFDFKVEPILDNLEKIKTMWAPSVSLSDRRRLDRADYLQTAAAAALPLPAPTTSPPPFPHPPFPRHHAAVVHRL